MIATAAAVRVRRPAWVILLGGIGAGVLGLLPWLVTGMRLPLQNLWAEDVLPDDMPVALLPFSQYDLALLLGMLVWGPAVAGLMVRREPVEARARAVLVAAIGYLVVAGVATAQAATVVADGLRADDPRSVLYFRGVLAVILCSVLVGVVVLVLLARAPRAPASSGATVAALACGIWLNALIVPKGVVASTTHVAVLGHARWIPAVLVGAALVWCGLGGVGKVVAWLVNIVLLWAVPAGLTAVSYAAGSRVLAGAPEEMLAAGGAVFVRALGPDGSSLGYAALALAIGVVGSGTRTYLARRRAGRAVSGESAQPVPTGS
ncbi:hypothetical protein [Georgenia subflava]|uniref:Uncharacterized protein n=1 Tax=Georgenia subflava TaxID=1622177 RepID=A0A6N7EBW8_9MICO|nr:hypothetical protein [Georgenia subflava]MPV35912.1 hypothetical protein [Georgenia subflava]